MNYRNTSFYVSFKVGSSIDLGWISSTRVSLLYNGILIGEASLEDNYIIPDESNMVDFELQELEIQNMLAFKAFIRHVIPQPRDRCQLKRKGPFAALEIVENGHMLSMAIHLDKMGVAEALDPVVHHAGNKIEITFFSCEIQPTSSSSSRKPNSNFFKKTDAFWLYWKVNFPS